MTFKEWYKEFETRRQSVLARIPTGVDPVEYFNYDNMKVNEPDFCPLYSISEKCHDMDNLNCYHCGCPFYHFSETPIRGKREQLIESICTINSKLASEFVVDGITKCDCSNCTIPHTEAFTTRYLRRSFRAAREESRGDS